MVKYEDWLTKSLEELENDFYNGVFKPQNESDVKCHIYHKLMEVKPEFPTIGRRHRVNTELPCTPFQGTQEKIDLALMSGEIPRLIIEIKETSKDHLSLEEASNKIAEDADKIRRFIESTINQSKIHRNMRKPWIILFFRGAGKHGIGTQTYNKLATLAKQNSDFKLWFGPR